MASDTDLPSVERYPNTTQYVVYNTSLSDNSKAELAAQPRELVLS